ncbi:MAG: ribonuclease III [Actinomycetota bacterium]
MSKPTDPASLLTALGLPAPEGSVYELALTHRSFAAEQNEPTAHNERLEFLGDAVLGLIVTDLIYRTRPEMAEGELSLLRKSVVEGKALAALARELGLGAHLRLGKGEEASGGRDKPSLLENTLEAVIGAVYLDRGLVALSEILVPVLGSLVDDSAAQRSGYDAKTALQEYTVRELGSRPSYNVASEGPDHDKRFVAHVHVNEELYGVGTGSSKKAAEQVAAAEALGRLEEESAESSLSATDEVRSNARAS